MTHLSETFDKATDSDLLAELVARNTISGVALQLAAFAHETALDMRGVAPNNPARQKLFRTAQRLLDATKMIDADYTLPR